MFTRFDIPPPDAQLEQATTLANNILQAQLGQVIALVLVIVVLVLGVFAVIFFRIINVIQRQTDATKSATEVANKQADNNSRLIDKLGMTNHAVEHLNNAMDEQTLVLHRLDDTMKANVALNIERNLKSDGMAADMKATWEAVKTLTDETATGRRTAVEEVKKAMTEHFESRDAKFDKIIELLEAAIVEMSDKQTEAAVVAARVEGKIDEALDILRHPTKDTTP